MRRRGKRETKKTKEKGSGKKIEGVSKEKGEGGGKKRREKGKEKEGSETRGRRKENEEGERRRGKRGKGKRGRGQEREREEGKMYKMSLHSCGRTLSRGGRCAGENGTSNRCFPRLEGPNPPKRTQAKTTFKTLERRAETPLFHPTVGKISLELAS